MDTMVDRILRCLNARQVRATYGSVAGLVGGVPIGIGARLGERRAEASWVVNGDTGLPTGYRDSEMHPNLRSTPRIIQTPEELSELLRECDSDVVSDHEAAPPPSARWLSDAVVP